MLSWLGSAVRRRRLLDLGLELGSLREIFGSFVWRGQVCGLRQECRIQRVKQVGRYLRGSDES